MRVEEELRAVMRDHDDEAPTHEVLRVPRRSRSWLPAATAALVVIALAATVAVVAHRGTHPARPAVAASPAPGGPLAPTSPLRCPTTEPRASDPGKQVPALPTVEGGAHRLVPDVAPRSVVVCGWIGNVFRRTVLTGDSTQLVADLTFAPTPEHGACTDDGRRSDGDDFLLGLSYADGTVWVAAPGDHCAGSSNGRFASAQNYSDTARSALSQGSWPTPKPPPADRLCGGTAGRLGQEKTLVPGRPERLQLCVTRGVGRTQTRTVRSVPDFVALVAALDRVRTTPSKGVCEGAPTSAATYTLVFEYRRGPSVVVRVLPFCRPSIDNGTLASTDDGAVVRELQRLARG